MVLGHFFPMEAADQSGEGHPRLQDRKPLLAREFNRLRADEGNRIDQAKAELLAVDRRLARIVDAIAGGTPARTLKEELLKLEKRQDELRDFLARPEPDRTLLHPGLAEVYRRKQRVRVEDGLIMVRDPVLAEYYVLPASSPWVISCGITGLSLTFGSSVSGGGGESTVGNDIELELEMASIKEGDCATIAPRLGKQLKALLQDSP
jgi:hypothetical protein